MALTRVCRDCGALYTVADARQPQEYVICPVCIGRVSHYLGSDIAAWGKVQRRRIQKLVDEYGTVALA